MSCINYLHLKGEKKKKKIKSTNAWLSNNSLGMKCLLETMQPIRQ